MQELKLDTPIMRGQEVKAWQAFLDRCGCFGINNDVDGKFGTLTDEFTRTWQSVRKLPVTGVVDKITLAAAVGEGFVPPKETPLPPSPLPTPTPVPSGHPNAQTASVIASVGSVNVWSAVGSSAFWFVSEMTIDADGAYRAYHPESKKGLDALSNAGKPGNWWALATDNGKPSGQPVIQGPNDPAPGFYISKTSLEDRNYKSTNPKRYVDSSSIPFMVLPPPVSKAGGAKLGDFATVVNLTENIGVHAIYADVGPKTHIGEASIRCAEALAIPSNPRSGGCESKTVLYIVYPGSGNGSPRTVGEIHEIGNSLFTNWGGITMAKAVA